MAFQWFPICLTHHIGHPVTFALPQAEDHPEEKSVQDTMEIQLNIYMTAALRSRRIAALTMYNRTDPTPKKIKSELTVSGLVFLQ